MYEKIYLHMQLSALFYGRKWTSPCLLMADIDVLKLAFADLLYIFSYKNVGLYLSSHISMLLTKEGKFQLTLKNPVKLFSFIKIYILPSPSERNIYMPLTNINLIYMKIKILVIEQKHNCSIFFF